MDTTKGKTRSEMIAENTTKRIAILRLIEESGGMETVDLVKHLRFPKPSLVDWLHSMLETGHLKRTKHVGKFGKHVWFWERGDNMGALGALSRRYAPPPKKKAPIQDMKRIFTAAAAGSGVCSYSDLPREFFGGSQAARA